MPMPAATGRFIPSSAPGPIRAPANSRSRSKTNCPCMRGWRSTTRPRPTHPTCAPISAPSMTTFGTSNTRSVCNTISRSNNYKNSDTILCHPLDDPLIANYSAYYRLPLGGYNFGAGTGGHQSRQFRLQRSNAPVQSSAGHRPAGTEFFCQPFHLRHRRATGATGLRFSAGDELYQYRDAVIPLVIHDQQRRAEHHFERRPRVEVVFATAANGENCLDLLPGRGLQALPANQLQHQRKLFFHPISRQQRARRSFAPSITLYPNPSQPSPAALDYFPLNVG